MKLLSSKPNEVYDSMIAIAVPHHDPETDNLKTLLITGPEGLAIQCISDTLARFLVQVTANLKTKQASKRKTKDDNSNILARRNAKDIATATEATAKSLEKEMSMNYTTMLTIIQDKSEKAAKKVSKSYLQTAFRKKALGNRRHTTLLTEPTTKGGNKSKASSGKKLQTNRTVCFHGSTKQPTNNNNNKPKDKPKTTNKPKTTTTQRHQPSNNNGKGKRSTKINNPKRTPQLGRRAGKRKDASNNNGLKKRTQRQK
jgi:hypothetical protein